MTSILVVDNEPDIANMLKRGLEINGFSADAFSDPFMALQNFRAGRYDLVVLDFKMHWMNGFELYDRLLKIDQNIKVLFLSGDSAHYAEYRGKYSSINPSHFLQKPISIHDFVKIVKSALSDRAN